MAALLLATRNAKKLIELRRLMPGNAILGLDDVPLYEEVPEDGATFEDNALLKAREGFAHTGLPTVADDSGLCVAALSGMPGIFSARWSGVHGDDEANTRLLLAQINDVPDDRRDAAFVCAAAYVDAEGEFVVRGEMSGSVIREPRGLGGFGYDPIFVPAGQSLTAAELAPERKDELSHRGHAMRLLVGRLAERTKT